MVPAYFYPSGSANLAAWQTLATQAARFPYRLVAVTNPNSGPGTSASSDYQKVIAPLQSSNGLSIGYVRTGYGSRAVSDVTSEVDKYYSFYPSIQGIFFDEASYTDGKQSYYQTLYGYVKSKNSNALVVTNPGTKTLESYLIFNGARVTDVVCVFEGSTQATTWTQEPWTKKYDRSNFCAIAYNIGSADMNGVMDRFYQQNVGWTYVTAAIRMTLFHLILQMR